MFNLIIWDSTFKTVAWLAYCILLHRAVLCPFLMRRQKRNRNWTVQSSSVNKCLLVANGNGWESIHLPACLALSMPWGLLSVLWLLVWNISISVKTCAVLSIFPRESVLLSLGPSQSHTRGSSPWKAPMFSTVTVSTLFHSLFWVTSLLLSQV